MKSTIATLLAVALGILSVSALAMIDVTNPLPTITAVTALVISFVNLYLSHFLGIHHTSCTLVAASYDGKQLIAHYSFENTGTYEEIILGATFVFPNPTGYSTLTRKKEDDFLPELCEPFVLKPKQAHLQKFAWNVEPDLLRTHFSSLHPGKVEYPIEIKVDFVHPTRRSKASKRFEYATLRFHESFISISKTYAQQNELFEGEMARI